MHFVVWNKRTKSYFVVLLFDKKPINFVNKIWVLLTKYWFFILFFCYKIAKYFVILLVYWFFTFCSVLLFSRTGLHHPAMFCLITLGKISRQFLNFPWRWRWWDQIQAIFLNLFYFKVGSDKYQLSPFPPSGMNTLREIQWGMTR